MAVELARLADRGRIDDRHHLFQVVGHHAVEERLVAVLQAHEVDVALEVGVLPAVGLEHARDLLVEGEDVRRQQPAQSQGDTLGRGERRPFVQQRIAQQRDPARKPGLRRVPFLIALAHHTLPTLGYLRFARAVERHLGPVLHGRRLVRGHVLGVIHVMLRSTVAD